MRLLTNNHGEASIGNINGLFSYIKLPSDTLSEYSPSPTKVKVLEGQYGHVLLNDTTTPSKNSSNYQRQPQSELYFSPIQALEAVLGRKSMLQSISLPIMFLSFARQSFSSASFLSTKITSFAFSSFNILFSASRRFESPRCLFANSSSLIPS